MSLIERKSRPFMCILLFLLSVLLVHASVWGNEASMGTMDSGADKPAITTAQSGTADDELASARAGVQEDPSNVQSRVRLAYLLIRKGAFDEAVRYFDETLKLNPRMYDAMTGKGIALARKGNLKEAERTLRKALFLNPNPVRTHYELGLVYEQLGDTEKAVAELKEGIRKHEQGR